MSKKKEKEKTARLRRICVAGGRDFDNFPALAAALEARLTRAQTPVVIVSGGARGADALGARFAQEHDLALEVHPADWAIYGRGAGCVRNKEMARVADELLVFWDGRSRGTAHMIRQMQKLDKPVLVFDYRGQSCPAPSWL